MTEQRLFVDCDDTLILYDLDGELSHPFGFSSGETYHANEPLIAFIKKFAKERPNALIVIWSGGGGSYAQVIADQLLPDIEIATMIKDKTTFGLVREGDMVIDDQPIDVGVTVIPPDFLG